MSDNLVKTVNETILNNDLIADQLKDVEKEGRCCCTDSHRNQISVPSEEESIRACVGFSLSGPNADLLLPLIFSQLTDDSFKFSSTSLRALILFLLNSSHSREQKFMVRKILECQLRMHPSCATYMSETYNDLMLAKDSSFEHLTTLDYVLTVLENILFYSEQKTYRSCKRKSTTHDAQIHTEREKGSLFRREAIEKIITNAEVMEEILDYVVWVLNFLIRILRHDLHVSLNNRNKADVAIASCIENSILGKLIFNLRDDSTVKRVTLTRIFAVFRKCSEINRLDIRKLVKIIADTCMLLDTYRCEGNRRIDFSNLGYFGRTFVDEFNIVLNGEYSLSYKLVLVSRLYPEWVRLHAAFHLLQNVWKKKITIGLHSIVSILETFVEKVEFAEPTSSKKILRCLNNVQFAPVSSDSNLIIDSKNGENLLSSTYDDQYNVKDLLNYKENTVNNVRMEGNEKFRRKHFKRLDSDFCKLISIAVSSCLSAFGIEEIFMKIENIRVNADFVTINSAIDYDFYKIQLYAYVALKKVIEKICELQNYSSELELLRVILK